MDLKTVVKRLEEYASLSTACDWDNVGLLVEPSGAQPVKRVLVTNDLTEEVLAEAVEKQINLIVSYHPAVFVPLKRLTQCTWKQRSIVRCIELGIAVYSPHTSWDSIDGGINDCVLAAFDTKKIESIQSTRDTTHPCGLSKSVRVNVPAGPFKDKLVMKCSSAQGSLRLIGEKELVGEDKHVELEFLASPNGVVTFIENVNSTFDSSQNVLNTLRIYELDKPNLKNVGLGRLGYLNTPVTIGEAVAKMKEHLGMRTVRLALGNGKTLDDTVKVIAVGAGSGSKLLNNCKADLIITGEFDHHEILHETHRGLSLIVTDHSNTERVYYKFFRDRFTQLLGKYGESVEILISEKDRDPLQYI